MGAQSRVLSCPAPGQPDTRWRVWRLEDAAKPGVGDASSAQHGNPSFPGRLGAAIRQLLAHGAARGRQMGMAGQGMVPDQAASPQPLDQLLHGGRARDLLKKRAQHLARGRDCIQDRAFNRLPGPAMHGLDPVPEPRDLDPAVLRHGGNGGKRHPLRSAAQIRDLIHVKLAQRRHGQHLPSSGIPATAPARSIQHPDPALG